MFRIASSRLSSRAASSSVSSTASFLASLTAKPSPVSLTPLAATSFRSYGNGLELDKSMANPDAINMINYALNQARTDKSIGSYGLGLLVLKHCLTIELTEGKDPKNENSKGIALLAMSTLEYERGEYDIALEKLQSIHELTNAYLGVRVAALEAEAGLYLELGQDDKASAIADKCVEVVEKQKTDDDDDDFKALILRAKALKGLIELVKGSIESAVPFFDKSLQLSNGTAALSYGEFLYLGQNYSMAKEVYTSVLKGASDIKKFGNPYLGACNMNLEGLMMGALCALGQLETYQGNYGNAEKALTQALTLAEETYGEKHPKVGVVLTSIALMYRRRAMEERTSSLLVQEGLYRKVIDILKVTETESEGSAPVVERSDIAAIARGGYAEILNVQENRKSEGEKLKKLAETIWKNRRLTLDEALLDLESTKISIIDPRISRIL